MSRYPPRPQVNPQEWDPAYQQWLRDEAARTRARDAAGAAAAAAELSKYYRNRERAKENANKRTREEKRLDEERNTGIKLPPDILYAGEKKKEQYYAAYREAIGQGLTGYNAQEQARRSLDFMATAAAPPGSAAALWREQEVERRAAEAKKAAYAASPEGAFQRLVEGMDMDQAEQASIKWGTETRSSPALWPGWTYFKQEWERGGGSHPRKSRKRTRKAKKTYRKRK